MAWDFNRVRANIRQAKEVMPKRLANLTQRYFVNSWKEQGWNGQHWEEVKRRIPGTKEYIYPLNKDLGRRTRAILVKSGKLRREVNDSIRVATFQKIRLVVGDREAKYAGYHNQGTDRIPKRQFMGQTPALTRQQKTEIDRYYKTMLAR
jgi:phage gpG-like protein